ncbi:HNH endonuclease [Streptomyces sp. MUSC 14]|uniref:HNH endonuclease n=1 Tax=Streptomyces sp. MUSC 14 TaxID=1354889 RepID=UPI0008F5A091|nr:HNH endonuclease [Streptomyces sp. MUSC 14]OIJ92126.1 HNH endonuclease [Streptomyces sp. MUSC 14]
MSLHDKPQLNSKVRRNRKARLAERDGQQCAYCRIPFASVREATLDHVVPISLFRTWSARHMVLACRSCNDRKADRFPLSMALVLLSWAESGRPTVDPTVWPLLARLAHAHRPTYEAVWSADPIGEESTPDLRDEPRHTRRHTPVPRSIVRPDCLRTPRPVRACAGPTGKAVLA